MAHGAQFELRPPLTAQRTGIAAALALHAIAVGALLTYAPARNALLEVAPIMVSLVAPPRPEVKPVVEPPRLGYLGPSLVHAIAEANPARLIGGVPVA